MKGDPSVRCYRGELPGPEVAIFAGVHGNELCGVQAIREGHVLQAFENLERGTVWVVEANPPAIQQGVRKLDADLNRCFGRDDHEHIQSRPNIARSEARQRAKVLMKILDGCKGLLDIHSTKNPQSTPFIIGEPHCLPLMRLFPGFRYLTHGWDQVQPGGTDYYMNSVVHPQAADTRMGICVECGQHSDPDAAQRAIGAILAFLAWYGLYGDRRKLSQTVVSPVLEVYELRKSSVDFNPAKAFADFEPVSAGQVLGTDGGESLRAGQDGVILFAQKHDIPDEEAYLLARPSPFETIDYPAEGTS